MTRHLPSIQLLLYGALGLLLGHLAHSHAIAAEMQYAQNLRIENFTTHRLITVKHIHRGSTEHYQYALVRKGRDLPPLPAGARIIRTPVERVVVMSTTFIGYIEALNRNHTLVGLSNPKLINSATVQKRITDGQAINIQSGLSIDIERMLLLQPDLVLTSSSGDPKFDVQPQLERSGLPIALSAAYMEKHPLARAEWIKFIAAFFEQDEVAHSLFREIARRYEHLSAITKDLPDSPTVFCGAPYSGEWYVPGGDSFMAQAIEDAGGDYVWSEDTTAGGIPLDLERVFYKAAHADIWLNPSSYRTLDELFSADLRFKKFQAAASGQVYNNNRQINQSGGNNIWERGTVHADEVLADLIAIFHPQLRQDAAFHYYRQLK